MIPRITQVQIRNYKSIAKAVIGLEPLTVFVGPNGAGKSNFLDAIAFVRECLAESVELAFKRRGGIGAVRRRSAGHPTHIGIRMDMELENGLWAAYAFEIAAKPTEQFRIARERCEVRPFMKKSHVFVFDVQNGRFKKEIRGIRPRVSADRLALFAASATEEFRPVYDFLTSMRFYSIVPTRLRELQDPDPGDYLKRDGSNAAAVLKRLAATDETRRYDRVCRLLSKVVRGLKKVEYQSRGQQETIKFKQDVGQKHPWTFEPLNMSDGTLRVLGLLLAVYQPGTHSVIAIEEPEATVHPAVAELIVQVLLDAAKERQVLFTTHSPDILDYKQLVDNQIRVVTIEQNRTIVAPLTESSRDAIRNHLYTPGELFRLDELEPDISAGQKSANQLNLFSGSS